MVEELAGGADLGLGHDAFVATDPALFARGLQAGLGAFDHEFSFHLGEGGHDVEEESSGDRRGVNRVAEIDKTYAAFIQNADEVQGVFHAPAQTVQLPHHQGVVWVEDFEGFIESRTFGQRTGEPMVGVEVIAPDQRRGGFGFAGRCLGAWLTRGRIRSVSSSGLRKCLATNRLQDVSSGVTPPAENP